MSDLDKKLRATIADIAELPETFISDQDLAQIQQVFRKAGWTYQERNLFKGLKIARTVMTGQEWFDKFKKIADEETSYDVTAEYLDEFLEMAKRASGLDK
jgi:ABC-type polar amino acid transport system ATPase subunit